jgi:hypothetical protein
VLCLLEICCVQGLTHLVFWECLNEPLNCAIRNFNNKIQCFDFCVSRDGFHELLRRNVQ